VAPLLGVFDSLTEPLSSVLCELEEQGFHRVTYRGTTVTTAEFFQNLDFDLLDAPASAVRVSFRTVSVLVGRGPQRVSLIVERAEQG
jgi:hypothetical protein